MAGSPAAVGVAGAAAVWLEAAPVEAAGWSVDADVLVPVEAAEDVAALVELAVEAGAVEEDAESDDAGAVWLVVVAASDGATLSRVLATAKATAAQTTSAPTTTQILRI
jgi:hypothetical protein